MNIHGFPKLGHSSIHKMVMNFMVFRRNLRNFERLIESPKGLNSDIGCVSQPSIQMLGYGSKYSYEASNVVSDQFGDHPLRNSLESSPDFASGIFEANGVQRDLAPIQRIFQ
jgi:hypothetical protein